MISVIIPTLNAENAIEKLLCSIKSQTISSEIIIVDSSSKDNTANISKSLGAQVISIKKEDFNHGKVRNIGVKCAKGDICVFMTQDALPYDRYALENLVKPIKIPKKGNEENKIVASYGRQIPSNTAKITEKFARSYNYPYASVIKGIEDTKKTNIKTFFFSNVFSAVRKDIFEITGGFPEDLYMFEDMLFAAKIMERGYKIAYVSQAKVIHSHNFSCYEYFKRYFFAGVSFKKNAWFMKLSSSEGEGLRFLIEEMKYLIKHRAYHWLPYVIVEAACKYTGLKLGTNYDKIPFLKKKFR